MKNRGILALTICLLTLVAGPALASGFSIFEQSAKASGQAGAWVARADDAAAAWYNPAAMTKLDGMQIQFGANLITIGSDTTLTVDGLGEFETVQNDSTPVHFYFTQKISDNVAWGLGVNTPFGLVTEWEDLPITLSSRKADLVTVVVNPSLAWAINDKWSVAFGLDYIYADVVEFSRDVDHSQLLGQKPLTFVGMSNLTGDGDDFGWNFGLHFANGPWSLGLTYRGALSPKIEGDVEFTDINENVAALFPDGPGTATLDLPAQAAIGVAYEFTEAWTAEFDISWAGWTSFEELAIDFENETSVPIPDKQVIPVVEDITLVEDWDDTMAFRLGAAWKLNDRHELRFGALFDQAPVQLDKLRPSIPDGDRTSVTFGYGFIGKAWNIDAYYMPLWFDDVDAEFNPLDPSVIPGAYESFVHLLGVTVNYRF